MQRAGSQNERGVALLAALMLVFVFSLLGLSSWQFASQEAAGTQAMQEDHVARHAAEAGMQLVMEWFHDPAARPSGVGAQVFAKTNRDAQGQPSYLDARGVSQFSGTAQAPDVLLDAGNPEHEVLLNHAQTGWFRSLRGLARVLQLKVYGPLHPGLLCTVEVVAASGPGQRTVSRQSVELGTYAIPPLTSAVQTVGLSGGAPDLQLPLMAHWGDIKIQSDVVLLNEHDVAEKSDAAPVTGQAYADMDPRRDRWFDLWSGGTVRFLRPLPGSSGTLPQNVHPQQHPMPGLKMDRWQYESLKRLAIAMGSYYGLDEKGRLHPGGIIQPGAGLEPDDVMASHSVGDHRGLVFVDTLDQSPPGETNLGTMSLSPDYMEGLFVINAHVQWTPKPSAKTIMALSPPPEDRKVMGLRIPVQLSEINLRGVLYTAGNLHYCGRPRVYGGLLSDGHLSVCANRDALMEVWYDAELSDGLHRGLPLVFVAPGTWQSRI